MFAIPKPRLESTGPELWRVTASVAGTEVFFEAAVPLAPRVESIVCPFLLPAMSQHADLVLSAPLTATFVDNLEFIRRRAMQWWPELSHGEIRCPIAAGTRQNRQAGLFYTGGVDSSYSLQTLRDRIQYAVFVEGFDIPLRDHDRLLAAREWLASTTRRCSVQLVVVRTNLREHPVFNGISWETTHIAALAGVAHTLGEHVGSMYVAASDVPPPYGSAPDLDGAWSSESVVIENFSAELSRLQRAASIAHWEPLRGRLRVCWENNTPDINCGFCEKCLRTRVQLLVSGAPDGLDSFPAGFPLLSTLRRLHSVSHQLRGQWRELAPLLNDPDLRAEVERLTQS
jgi:hypothetical protein